MVSPEVRKRWEEEANSLDTIVTRTVARTKKNLADDLTWQLPPTSVNGGKGRITKPEYLSKDNDG